MSLTAFPINTTALATLGAEIVSAVDSSIGTAWKKSAASASFNTGTRDLTITMSDASTVVVNIPGASADIYVDGGSYDVNTMTLTLTDNDGGTPDVTVDFSGLTVTLTDNGDGTWDFGDGRGATAIGTVDARPSADADNLIATGTDGKHRLEANADAISSDSDNLIIKGTDAKLSASLDAATIGVPLTGNYVLGWSNGVLTVFPL